MKISTFVNGNICSCIAAVSVSLPYCKKWHRLPGLPSSEQQIIGLAKQTYLVSTAVIWLVNFLSLRNTLQNREKFKFLRSLRVTLGIRAIRGVKSTKLDSCRSTYIRMCISLCHGIIKIPHSVYQFHFF
jgi:hypothetical protein